MESATPAGEAILWSDFAVKRTLESQQITLHQAVAQGEEFVTLLGSVGNLLKSSEEDAKFDAVRNAVQKLVDARHRLDVHHNALSQLRYQPTGETTDFTALLSTKTNQINETIAYDVNLDPLLAQFDQEAGAAAPEDDIIDDEIAIAGTSTQQVSRNERCPISAKPILELEDPVVDHMNFVYDKACILQIIGKKESIKCPVAGTMHNVTAAELKPAKKVIAERKKLARLGGKHANKQVNAGEVLELVD
ncbi:hypothetical protein Ndes2437B_g08086 [Nannochloris sp. 'desiccata']